MNKNSFNRLFQLASAGTLLCLLASAQAAITITDYQPVFIQTITVERLEEGAKAVRLQIDLPDQPIHLNLHENQLLLSHLPVFQQKALSDSGNAFYSGTIDGITTSWVRLSYINGNWSGGFFDGQELWLVDNAERLANALIDQPHPATGPIVYRLSDFHFEQIIDNGGITPPGTGTTPLSGDEIIAALQTLNARGTFQILPMTIVTDTQFNNEFGSNTAAIVAGRFNFVDGLFTNQVGVGLQLEHLEMLSNNGPLTEVEASDLLDDFRVFVNNSGNGIPRNGSNHLFTGRNLQATNPMTGVVSTGVVGIAYRSVNVLCGSFAYGVDEDFGSETTSSLIFAHELGHNFNAPHDRQNGSACQNSNIAGIMNPNINGSQQFSDCSLEQMAPAIAQASCLIEQNETFFIDGFEAN